MHLIFVAAQAARGGIVARYAAKFGQAFGEFDTGFGASNHADDFAQDFDPVGDAGQLDARTDDEPFQKIIRLE